MAKDIDQTDWHNSRSQKIKLIKIAMKRQKKENIQHIQIRMGMMADCLW